MIVEIYLQNVDQFFYAVIKCQAYFKHISKLFVSYLSEWIL